MQQAATHTLAYINGTILCRTGHQHYMFAIATCPHTVHLAGGIPVLIAAIGTSSMAEKEQSRVTAAAALGVLQSLTSRAVLPCALVDQAEDLMLRLQALPRLSTLLRSLTIAPTQALGQTTGSSDLRLALCETYRDALNTSAPQACSGIFMTSSCYCFCGFLMVPSTPAHCGELLLFSLIN